MRVGMVLRWSLVIVSFIHLGAYGPAQVSQQQYERLCSVGQRLRAQIAHPDDERTALFLESEADRLVYQFKIENKHMYDQVLERVARRLDVPSSSEQRLSEEFAKRNGIMPTTTYRTLFTLTVVTTIVGMLCMDQTREMSSQMIDMVSTRVIENLQAVSRGVSSTVRSLVINPMKKAFSYGAWWALAGLVALVGTGLIAKTMNGSGGSDGDGGSTMRTDVNNLSRRVDDAGARRDEQHRGLQQQVDEMGRRVSGLEGDVAGLQTDMRTLSGAQQAANEAIARLGRRATDADDGLRSLRRRADNNDERAREQEERLERRVRDEEDARRAAVHDLRDDIDAGGHGAQPSGWERIADLAGRAGEAYFDARAERQWHNEMNERLGRLDANGLPTPSERRPGRPVEVFSDASDDGSDGENLRDRLRNLRTSTPPQRVQRVPAS